MCLVRPLLRRDGPWTAGLLEKGGLREDPLSTRVRVSSAGEEHDVLGIQDFQVRAF